MTWRYRIARRRLQLRAIRHLAAGHSGRFVWLLAVGNWAALDRLVEDQEW